MRSTALQLWLAYPADMPMRDGLPACAGLLDEEERKRLDAFRFDEHRQEFGTTRALVRTALSAQCAVKPADWRFQTNEWGKPEVETPQELQFNLSNCPGLVVCLIGWGYTIGVDAESFARANEILELSEQVFSLEELTQLEALPPDERPRRALALWTLKEAYTKARGMGLSLPMRKFSFLFEGEDEIRLELDAELKDTSDHWQFCLLEQAEHQIAIVTEHAAPTELEMWEVRPAHGTARRLGLRPVHWFPATVGS